MKPLVTYAVTPLLFLAVSRHSFVSVLPISVTVSRHCHVTSRHGILPPQPGVAALPPCIVPPDCVLYSIVVSLLVALAVLQSEELG